MTPWSAFPTVMFSLVYPFLVIATYAAGDDYRSSRAPMFLVLIPILIGLGFLQRHAGLRLLPDQLALSLLGTPAYEVTALPPVVAGIALSAWASLAATAAAAALLSRDAAG